MKLYILYFLKIILALRFEKPDNQLEFRYKIIENKILETTNNVTMTINATLDNVEMIITHNGSMLKKVDILTSLTSIIKSLGPDYEEVLIFIS
jgi:hypothetical protein